MFEVKNGVYQPVKIAWAGITLPLKAGTPVSLAGAVSNNGNAIGIVPQTVTVLPVIPEMNILVGGDVDLAECQASYGAEYDDAAIQAMDGIRFFKDGTPVDRGSGGGFTLYGPYWAIPSSSTTISAESSDVVYLDDITDADENAVTFDGLDADTKFFMVAYGLANDELTMVANVTYASMPIYNGDGFDAPYFGVMNTGNESVTVTSDDAMMTFYSTAALPVSDSGDDSGDDDGDGES